MNSQCSYEVDRVQCCFVLCSQYQKTIYRVWNFQPITGYKILCEIIALVCLLILIILQIKLIARVILIINLFSIIYNRIICNTQFRITNLYWKHCELTGNGFLKLCIVTKFVPKKTFNIMELFAKRCLVSFVAELAKLPSNKNVHKLKGIERGLFKS